MKEAGQLLFGQQHVGSRPYFIEQHGQYHTIPLAEFPHVRFLVAPDGPDVFDGYLQHSWSYVRPDRNSPFDRAAHMERFRQRAELVKRGERDEEPVLVTRRRDGHLVLVDGNHRAAIAYTLGRPLRVRELSASEWLEETASESNRYFGASHRGMPYQSVFDREREMVRGRRRDTAERFQHIREGNLGSVLDLGCNLGAIVYMALDRGAKQATGLEIDPLLVSSAIRMNAYFAAAADFHLHDLNEPYIPQGPVDTLMCFSVAAHLNTLAGLEETIRRCSAKVMYFEGHAGTCREDYPTLLDADFFRSVELVGLTASSNPQSADRRPVFRCVSDSS